MIVVEIPAIRVQFHAMKDAEMFLLRIAKAGSGLIPAGHSSILSEAKVTKNQPEITKVIVNTNGWIDTLRQEPEAIKHTITKESECR